MPSRAPEPPHVGALLLEALRLVRRAWSPLLTYGVATGLLLGLVLLPLVAWLLGTLLSLTGAGAVLNYDIASLALSVKGIALLAVWAVVTAFLAVLVYGGPVLHTAAARADLALPPRTAAWRTLRAWGRVPGRGAGKLALLAALLIPLVTSGAAALAALALLPFGGDPLGELVAADLRGLTGLAVGVSVLALLGFLLYVRWSLCVHTLLLEGKTLTDATRRSAELLKGAYTRTAAALLAHHVTQALLLAALTFVLGALDYLLLVRVLGPDSSLFLPAVAALVALHAGVLGLAGLFGVSREAALMTLIYTDRVAGGVATLRAEVTEAGDIQASDLRRLSVRRVVILGGLVLAVATALTVPLVYEEVESMERPVLVTAHRGSSAEAPENSMAAILLSIQDGADAVEFDVHQAKDGALMVVHDAHLERITGVDRYVYEMTGAELARLDVGTHFDPRFADERMPTLEDVIQATQGKIRLNIELKTHGKETDAFVTDVVALIRKYDVANDIIITSLDQKTLRRVRTEAPNLRIGMIVSAILGSEDALDVDLYSILAAHATVDFVRRAHRTGREVHVWTINDRAGMERHIARGADNLITDYPKEAKAATGARTTTDALRNAITRLLRP